jgi:hypothetical protein
MSLTTSTSRQRMALPRFSPLSTAIQNRPCDLEHGISSEMVLYRKYNVHLTESAVDLTTDDLHIMEKDSPVMVLLSAYRQSNKSAKKYLARYSTGIGINAFVKHLRSDAKPVDYCYFFG